MHLLAASDYSVFLFLIEVHELFDEGCLSLLSGLLFLYSGAWFDAPMPTMPRPTTKMVFLSAMLDVSVLLAIAMNAP
jgi:hypothetical protein